MAVPGGSEIGSLNQGVRRSFWLLLPQTKSAPDSETSAPNFELPMMLTQRAAGCHDDHPRGGLQCDQFFLGNFSGRAEINASGLIYSSQVRLCFNEPAQSGGQRFFVAGQFLAHQHEIGLQSTQMPEGV